LLEKAGKAGQEAKNGGKPENAKDDSREKPDDDPPKKNRRRRRG
jgi:hypothetical protein